MPVDPGHTVCQSFHIFETKQVPYTKKAQQMGEQTDELRKNSCLKFLGREIYRLHLMCLVFFVCFFFPFSSLHGTWVLFFILPY